MGFSFQNRLGRTLIGMALQIKAGGGLVSVVAQDVVLGLCKASSPRVLASRHAGPQAAALAGIQQPNFSVLKREPHALPGDHYAF